MVGPNGGGKTTLVKLILGLLQPGSGEVRVFGRPPRSVRLRMGYMPQSPYAFGFTVQKNVEMAIAKSPSMAKQALRALKAVGMADMANARGNKLSGGETQRMALARMIALPRKLLLLDEPTSAADIEGTDQIENTLLRYAADTGCTVILSTHSPAQALRLAEEIVFLDQGEIVEHGPSVNVLKNPQSERAKMFLEHWRI